MRAKIMPYLFLLMFASLLTGCVTIPTREEMSAAVSGYELPKQTDGEYALLYVVRPSGFGAVIRFNVFLDDKEDSSEMGYTRGGQYIYFYVTPGKHKILSKAENWAEFDIDAKPKETVFLKQNVEMGFIIARNSIEQLQEVEGKYFVKNAEVGTIIKERK